MDEQETTVLAIGAHPDDIEFMMGGTLIHLREAGCRIHMMNLANGDCGSTKQGPAEIAAVRLDEARAAAGLIGATHHPPLARDLEIVYEPALLRRLAAVIREIQPRILLIPSLEDYMEDHMITARLAVTAAFSRAMPNFVTDPPADPQAGVLAVYHALPYGLRDAMGHWVRAECYVDIAGVMETKRAMLACHKSQQDWLETSQGINRYLSVMDAMAEKVGQWSKCFSHAEGWRRHNPLGFCEEGWNPLAEILDDLVAADAQ